MLLADVQMLIDSGGVDQSLGLAAELCSVNLSDRPIRIRKMAFCVEVLDSLATKHVTFLSGLDTDRSA